MQYAAYVCVLHPVTAPEYANIFKQHGVKWHVTLHNSHTIEDRWHNDILLASGKKTASGRNSCGKTLRPTGVVSCSGVGNMWKLKPILGKFRKGSNGVCDCPGCMWICHKDWLLNSYCNRWNCQKCLRKFQKRAEICAQAERHQIRACIFAHRYTQYVVI